MADETRDKAIATRDTQWGRWVIIRECRVPCEYTKAAGSKHAAGKEKVAPSSVKAVLQELGQWDPKTRTIYQGIASIAHHTQLSERDVKRAIKALREAKLIRVRKSRGLGQTKITELNWDGIEKRRESFSVAFRREAEEDALDRGDVPPAASDEPPPVKSPEENYDDSDFEDDNTTTERTLENSIA